jgi:hypothetical protein
MGTYFAKGHNGTEVSISGQAKNQLLNVFGRVMSIAATEKWVAFWQEEYDAPLPGEYDSWRKLLWIRQEKRWFFTDVSTVMVYPSDEHVEALLGEAIEEERAELRKLSAFLETLTASRARELLEAFSCFNF